jgi:hypothetical protein
MRVNAEVLHERVRPRLCDGDGAADAAQQDAQSHEADVDEEPGLLPANIAVPVDLKVPAGFGCDDSTTIELKL